MGEIGPTFDGIERLCPACDYDLRATPGERCPECGTVIGSIDCAIPWAHRRQLGWVRAFWRTVKVGMRAKRLAQAVSQPVDYTDARRFAWIVAVIAAVPIVGVYFLGIALFGVEAMEQAQFLIEPWRYGSTATPTLLDQLTLFWAAGATLPGVIPIGVLLMVFAWMGAPAFWVGGGSELSLARRNRAIALSYYTCGPLVWTFLPCVSLALAIVSDPWKLNLPILLNAALGMLVYVAPVILVLWWWNMLRLVGKAAHGGIGRIAGTAIGLPIVWGVAGVLCVMGFPAIVGLVRILVDSFQN